MPWSSRKSRKLATTTSLMLGLIASIPINLASTWFQVSILSNGWYTALAVLLLLATTYWFINRRTTLSTIVFVTLAYSVLFNLVASWFLVTVLHNSFTVVSILVIVLLTVILPLLSVFIYSEPKRTGEADHCATSRCRNDGITIARRQVLPARSTSFGIRTRQHSSMAG